MPQGPRPFHDEDVGAVDAVEEAFQGGTRVSTPAKTGWSSSDRRNTASEREKERIGAFAAPLPAAWRPPRILQTLGWAPAVKEAFLAAGGRALPQVRQEVRRALRSHPRSRPAPAPGASGAGACAGDRGRGFREVFAYFLDRTGHADRALTGGAPSRRISCTGSDCCRSKISSAPASPPGGRIASPGALRQARPVRHPGPVRAAHRVLAGRRAACRAGTATRAASLTYAVFARRLEPGTVDVGGSSSTAPRLPPAGEDLAAAVDGD